MDQFSLDHLVETEFEQFCYDLLSELAFVNINWRKGTGLSSSPADRGRDIECQRILEDIDGTKYFETWFVECKHYQQGVPPDKIQGALAWATSERPDKLLIITSNFLSNPTKDYLQDYIKNSKPYFKVKYWEKPDLEKLALDKAKLLRKYKIATHVPDLVLTYLVNFKQHFDNFEQTLFTALLVMGTTKSQSQFQSVVKMWKTFSAQVGCISDHYDQVVKEAIAVRNEFAHALSPSYTLEELTTLVTQLYAVSIFVRDYCISEDILPALKRRYPKWLRPEITSVRIIQKNRAVFLEMVTASQKFPHSGDEEVTRTHLGFVSEGNDKLMFPPEQTAKENAQKFVNEFDPYSIINCTYIFSPAFYNEISELYNSGSL